MQAAIDRVLRTFTLKPPVSLVETAHDDHADTSRDQASVFAARLLDNYRDQLVRRSAKHD